MTLISKLRTIMIFIFIATATNPATIELDSGSETDGPDPSQADSTNIGGQYQFYRIPL